MSSAVIVYYSMDGNTKQIAEQIQRETGYPLVRLEPAVPYTGTDEEIVAQGQEEVNRGFRPELKPLGFDPEEYDTGYRGDAHLVVHHGVPRPQLSLPGGLEEKDPDPLSNPRGLARALSGGHGADLPGGQGAVP